jgi:tRNA A37 methylthiotransferase MiaB
MGFSKPFSLIKADEVFFRILPANRTADSCFITIGSGCQGRCTYCSIRAGRGAARSLPLREILADAGVGLRQGRRRFVLIADDAGCWGRDIGLDLPHLLGRLRAKCPTARFDLLDFNPVNLPRLFERLRPFLSQIDHFYLPLQAGSDRILRLMRRGYAAGDILPLLRLIRETNPSVSIETDIIVGFPTETRQEFLKSLRAAQIFNSAAFVPFVPKPDTPAAKLRGRIAPAEMRLRLELVRRMSVRHGFKIIDPSISGHRHGGVGKLPDPRSEYRG